MSHPISLSIIFIVFLTIGIVDESNALPKPENQALQYITESFPGLVKKMKDTYPNQTLINRSDSLATPYAKKLVHVFNTFIKKDGFDSLSLKELNQALLKKIPDNKLTSMKELSLLKFGNQNLSPEQLVQHALYRLTKLVKDTPKGGHVPNAERLINIFRIAENRLQKSIKKADKGSQSTKKLLADFDDVTLRTPALRFSLENKIYKKPNLKSRLFQIDKTLLRTNSFIMNLLGKKLVGNYKGFFKQIKKLQKKSPVGEVEVVGKKFAPITN